MEVETGAGEIGGAGVGGLRRQYSLVCHLGTSWGLRQIVLGPSWCFLGPPWKHVSRRSIFMTGGCQGPRSITLCVRLDWSLLGWPRGASWGLCRAILGYSWSWLSRQKSRGHFGQLSNLYGGRVSQGFATRWCSGARGVVHTPRDEILIPGCLRIQHAGHRPERATIIDLPSQNLYGVRVSGAEIRHIAFRPCSLIPFGAILAHPGVLFWAILGLLGAAVEAAIGFVVGVFGGHSNVLRRSRHQLGTIEPDNGDAPHAHTPTLRLPDPLQPAGL